MSQSRLFSGFFQLLLHDPKRRNAQRCRNPVYFQDFFNASYRSGKNDSENVAIPFIFRIFSTVRKGNACQRNTPSQSRLFSGFFQLCKDENGVVVLLVSQSRLFSGFFQLYSRFPGDNRERFVAIPFIFRIFSTQIQVNPWTSQGIDVAIPFIFRIFSTLHRTRSKTLCHESQSRLFSGFFQHTNTTQ